MILDPEELAERERYKLLIGTIVPRPIAWVSTMGANGVANLAPFSYFTIASTNPMTLLFCPQIPGSGGGAKDTLRNIEQVPEFVINLTNEETAEAMNLTATSLPYGQSEFQWAHVTPAPSQTLRVPRVAEAPVSFECTLLQIVTVSQEPGGGSIVLGQVQAIHIREDIYVDGYVRLEVLKPIGRLAGTGYTRVTDIFDMVRVPPPNPS